MYKSRIYQFVVFRFAYFTISKCFLLCASSIASSAEQIDKIREGLCRDYNIYYEVENSCDSYIECHRHKATNKICPAGLHFLRDVLWPTYPCAYPSDAHCDSDVALQKALYMPKCKSQYGLFASPLATRTDCGKYRMCMDGRPIEKECSTGMAFNPEVGRCDWPELVPACDTDAFLGFKCPPATFDEYGKAIVEIFGMPGTCRYYMSCMSGVGHVLLCEPGYAFDKTLKQCVDATRVYCED